MASSSTSSTRNDDRVDSLISLGEKLMDKFESLGAKYQEEASTTLDAITKNTEKLVEKMNNMKCLTTKADTSVVSQLHTRVTGLEQKVANVESQISTYNDSKKKDENAIKEYVERAVEARALLDVDETAEKEKRKTSVIIHGIKESDIEDSKEREEDDLGVVASMLHELKCKNAAVQKVVRLGKRLDSVEDNVPTKPRPMKMVVETEEQRNLIIRSAKNLRLAPEGDWKTVYIHQDLTPKERNRGDNWCQS